MSGQRKLQQEMDRVFKKITEGLEIFDSIYDRHQNASNSSQKDKLENDLKKEIKKLQRFREQVKNWQTGTEIKDKSQLLEHRKLVEVAMEKYKEVEKGSKLKAYSDISLAAVDKPAVENEAIDFVNQSIDSLQQQTESMEAEMDKLTGGGKKGKKKDFVSEERKRELVELLSTHQWHIDKLETILKLLQNEILPVEDVMEISDDINYYIEENENPDFIYDDSIYDDLDLDVTIEEENVDINDINEENSISANTTVAVSTPPTSSDTPSKNEQIPPLSMSTSSGKSILKKKPTNDLLDKRSNSKNNLVTPPTDKQVHQLSSTTTTTTTSNHANVTTLKPAPAPVPAPAMNWSAAISTPKVAPKPLATTPIQAPRPSNVNALNAASVLEALKKQKPKDESNSVSPTSILESSLQQERSIPTINATPSPALITPSVETSQVISPPIYASSTNTTATTIFGQSPSQLEASNDASFRFLPTGIQSIILSLAQSKDDIRIPYNPLASVNFTPKGTYPPSIQAAQLNQIWNKISHSDNLESILNKLECNELFYGSYYGISNEERQLSEDSLHRLGWLKNKDNSQWVLPRSVTSNDNYSIGDYEVFDPTKWSINEKKGLKFDNNQLV